MKIAMLVSTFYPKIGGMGRVVLLEARELVRLGNQVTVFTMAYPGHIEGEEFEGIKIKRIKPIIRLGDGGFLPNFSESLKGFDIVHLHYPFYGAVQSILSLKKQLNTKIILSLHMVATPRGMLKQLFKFFYDCLFDSKLIKKADKILVVSKKYFQDYFSDKKVDQSKVFEFLNPIDTEQFFYSPKDDVSSKKKLLFAGNLLPLKGLPVLLDLVNKYKEKYELTVVGGGYNEAEYKNFVKQNNLADSVFFLGSISDDKQLVQIFHQADALVVPSLKESFSLVAGEAMSAGLPVVTADIPGLKDKIADGVNGFLFKGESIDDLDKTLDKLFSLNNDEFDALLNRARKMIVDKYSLSCHIENLLQFYA